ncbi:leishmanolysin-related zinc metalloendopeptidase [Shimia sp. W99]
MQKRDFAGPGAPLADLLPPEFDAELVASFFDSSATDRKAELLPDSDGPVLEQVQASEEPQLEETDNTNHLSSDRTIFDSDTPASSEADKREFAKFEAADPLVLVDSYQSSNAFSGLEIAGNNAPIDLWKYARPLGEHDDATDSPLTGAGAKPTWSGGGKGSTDDGSDSGTGGKGKGKTKSGDGTTGDDGVVTPPPDDGVTPVEPDFVSGMDNPTGYNIAIVYVGTWSETLRQGIENAAEMISTLITDDLPDHNGIDDISITATLENIDGTDGYWGWGGYDTLRSDSLLPSSGYIKFDTSDTDRIESLGLWEDLMLHEMLHALGFGTTWSDMGLVEDFGGDLRFTGANATAAYNRDFADIAKHDALADFGVAVETEGGPGTAGVHWDDATFKNELMTGQLNYDNYLSDMSIAALEDMGYGTVLADSFIFT